MNRCIQQKKKKNMDIRDYLQVDCEIAGIDPDEMEVRLDTKIVEVPTNKFYVPTPNKRGIRHFRLDISAKKRWLEDDEDEEWETTDDSDLWFFMSAYDFPDIEDFTKHIHKECSEALFALHYPDRYDNSFRFKCDISMQDVYVYLRNKPIYQATIEFVRDYEFWSDRIYNTQKWFHYLLGDKNTTWSRWSYPVGGKLYKFISSEDFPLEIVKTRASLT